MRNPLLILQSYDTLLLLHAIIPCFAVLPCFYNFGHFHPYILNAGVHYVTRIDIKYSTYLPKKSYPRLLQNTCVFIRVHPSLLKVPHLPLKHTSNLPSNCDSPSISLIYPSVQLPVIVESV